MRRVLTILAALFFSTQVHAGTIYNIYLEEAFGSPSFRPLGPSLPVIIKGTPPNGLRPADIIDLLSPPAWTPNTRFRLSNETEAGSGMRLVLTFGSTSVTRLCETPSGGSDTGRLAAGTCLGGTTISVASMRLSQSRSLDRELGDLVRILAPVTSPRRRETN